MAKPKLVIFEGPNGTGKSTLIAELCKLPDFVLYETHRKPGKSSDKAISENRGFEDLLMQFAQEHPGKTVLLDRHLWSSIAYPEMRDESLTTANWFDVHKSYHKLSCRFILTQVVLMPTVYREHKGSADLSYSQYGNLTRAYANLCSIANHMMPWLCNIALAEKPDVHTVLDILR